MVSSKNLKVRQKRCLGTSIESSKVIAKAQQGPMWQQSLAHSLGILMDNLSLLLPPQVHCFVEIFQLIYHWKRVNATSQYDDGDSSKFKLFKIVKRLDGCSGETLLAPCARKKRLQRLEDQRMLMNKC